jgi:aryl-alcohol dehydrogenase-like predicted oxidoreductase
MEYRTLGHTGTAVSTIALGTMDFGSLTPEEDAFAVLDAYLDAGGNLLDTSNVYNGGLVEEVLGRWLASRPAELTDRVVLATKGRFSVDADPVNGVGASRRWLTRSLDQSLRRLGRENVDLYQIHGWDPITPIEETLTFLDAAVRSGKVNHVGLSNFTGWQLQLAVSTAKALGLTLPVTLQPQYSLLSREIEWEVVPAAVHNGVGLLPWSPLAGGFLSGKYTRGVAPAATTRAGSDNPLYQWASQEYADSDRNWAVIAEVVRIAGELDVTPTQVALSWLADRPGVVAPITSARTVGNLRENLGASGLHLDAASTARLEELSRPTPGGYPYGAFGAAQRSRDFHGSADLGSLVSGGSDQPTGRS